MQCLPRLPTPAEKLTYGPEKNPKKNMGAAELNASLRRSRKELDGYRRTTRSTGTVRIPAGSSAFWLSNASLGGLVVLETEKIFAKVS